MTTSGIVGMVDGVADGDLRGWIVDLRAPSRAVTVWCVGRTGERVALAPTQKRDDAGAAIGTVGVRGFSVPVDLLTPLGGVVAVRNEHGECLAGGERIRIPRRRATSGTGDDRTWLFIHIPKTAGSSLRAALLPNSDGGDTLLVYPDGDLGVSAEECLLLPEPQRKRFRRVYGHFRFGLHGAFAPDARYVTVVREPRARLRSNFAHHAAAGTPFAMGGVPIRPSILVNEGLSEEFDNLATRMIAGVSPAVCCPGLVGPEHVDQAIDNVRRRFAFVGQQETLSRDARQLQALLGVEEADLPRANVTPDRSRYADDEIAAVDWRAVDHRNRFDVLLHEKLEALGLLSRPIGG